jgi:hypothetical protein
VEKSSEDVVKMTATGPEQPQARLDAVLATYTPMSLAEMARVALLDRVEVKYLFAGQLLGYFLAALRQEYALLVVEGQAINRYQTLYFDTADFALYRRHHMGARNRYKIRAREYVESGDSFLEIKHKTNRRRTVKSRIATPQIVDVLEGGAAQFVSAQCPYRGEELAPRLWNHYRRITLINKRDAERVTLDIDLCFTWQGDEAPVAGVVVAEVKRAAHSCPSPFITLMRAHGIRRTSFSKYCVGVSLLYPELKHNKFKRIQRHVARVAQADSPEFGQGAVYGSA